MNDQKRLRMGEKYPTAYSALTHLDGIVAGAGLDNWYKEMIRIKASLINGCAYCVDMHSQDAIKLGIHPRKIALVSVWREAKNHFTEEEQLILQLTEELTLVHQHGIPDETYHKAITLFGEEGTAQIIMSVIVINAWNRLGVGLHLQPEF